MDEQLYFVSPFGLERVHAEHRFVEGWGWTWAVSLFNGVKWVSVDSGHARSDRSALRLIAGALERLADYEDIDEIAGEPF